MFGAMSINPWVNQVIRPFIALAPVMSLSHISAPLRALARLPLIPDLLGRLEAPFLPSSRFLTQVERTFCHPPLRPLCLSLLGILGGFDDFMLNKTRLPVYETGFPAGSSNKNLALYSQHIRSGRFADYDYGTVGNLRRYGQVTPPEFVIERITNQHICLISGNNDFLAPPKDVDVLRSRLKVKLHADLTVPYARWSHFDFAIGLQADAFVTRPVLKLLSEFDPHV